MIIGTRCGEGVCQNVHDTVKYTHETRLGTSNCSNNEHRACSQRRFRHFPYRSALPGGAARGARVVPRTRISVHGLEARRAPEHDRRVLARFGRRAQTAQPRRYESTLRTQASKL